MSIVRELKRRNVFRMAVLYMVAAWLIMQVTEVLIALTNLPVWIGPIIVWLLAIGFPISMIFSWFYEITPEGISLEKDVDPKDSITHITGRRLDFIVISMLVAAVILFAYDKWWIGPPPEKSIAVLPFTNMSGDPEQEYFADGIHGDLLTLLANLDSLMVISRTSVMEYRDTTKNMKTIGEELGVATILEGGVQRAGNQIRINVQLIDASTDDHIWAKTYDRTLTPELIFAIQSEIATSIAKQLEAALSQEDQKTLDKKPTQNLDAYNAYLRGRHLVVQRTRATIEGAVREFEKAVMLDPDYALGHAELAIAILLLGTYGDLTSTEAIARAAPHADRALALDPTLAEAHAATGFIFWYQWNQEEALIHYKQAIEINPNYSIVYVWMGNLFNDDLGRYAEGFAAQEMTLRLDPLSIPAIGNIAVGLIDRNRLDEADRELEKLASIAPSLYARLRGNRTSVGGKWANAVLGNLDGLRIDPENTGAKNSLTGQFAFIALEREALAISEADRSVVLRMLGRPADAATNAETSLAEDPDSIWDRRNLGLALASAGDYDRARSILEEMWQRSDRRITHFGLFRAANAAALIAIRRDASEKAEAGELVAAIRDNVRRFREAGMTGTRKFFSADYDEGLAAYLEGEHEAGLALIAEAAEEGFFIMPREAYLQTLYDDPGFAPIRAGQEARQKRERDRFLAIVCTDNPYAAVWQPEDGTCERFAATVGN